MSRGWLRAISGTPRLAAGIEIAGVVDLDESQARGLAEDCHLDGALVGTDLGSVLTKVKPDLVFDIVVPSARNEVVSTALAHGCHVLSEKPMAVSLADARQMIDQAEQAGKIHAITQNRRYVAGAQRVRQFIETGKLGKLTGVHCDFFLAPHFGGFREEMDHVLLLDMAIHTFDAARFMSGEEPVAVYCLESNPDGSWYRHGAAANAIFELTNNVTFTYRGSWCADGFRTSWEAAWRFVGTNGSLVWDGADAVSAELVGDSRGLFSDVIPTTVPALQGSGFLEGHTGVISDFLCSVESGREPPTVNTDNIKSLAMVLGAIESARAGRRMPI